MDHGPTRRRFDELLAATGAPLGSLTPRAGLEIMVRLCDEVAGTAFLVCGWTSLTRYVPDAQGFAWTLYRKFEDSRPPEAHGGPLGLLFRVDLPPSVDEILRLFGIYDRAEDAAGFWRRIEATEAFQRFGDARPVAVALKDDTTENHDHDLFDCWGNRDPTRPVVTMTEAEWLGSTDVGLMLRWFRQQWTGPEADLDRLILRYLLACCRRIWPLLLMHASRYGVEVAERYLDGKASREEYDRAEYHAEGAAYSFFCGFDEPDAEEPLTSPQRDSQRRIASMVRVVEAIPPDEFRRLVNLRAGEVIPHTGRLLEHAAYFVDSVLCYDRVKHKERIEEYHLFLPTALLREMVGNPFRRDFPRLNLGDESSMRGGP